MVGSSLVEVCGRILFGLTRSVAEHYNPNDNESNPELFSLNRRERTGFEWNIDSDEEFIFQEYGDKQVSRSAGYIGQARLINARSPEDQFEEDAQDKPKNRAMEWKQFRPSLIYSLWNSLYFGFLISVLAAALIGTLSIIVYYVAYQVTLVCLGRPKGSIPSKVQWSKTISECMEIIFFHLRFFINTLFYFKSHQIVGLKRKLFLVSFVFYVLDVASRITLQALGISRSELTLLQIVPTNVLIFFSLGVQCWVLARRFFRAVGSRKLTTFLWMIGSRAFPFIVGILFSGFIYPAYDKQDKTGKIYIAVFTPLITVLLKGSSRLFLQRLWKISHPGKTFVFLAPLYYGSAVALRLLQVDLDSLKAVALIGVIHGVAEVIERSVIVLIDYIYYQIHERRRLSWESFRTARRERLATDIAIMSMQSEASAVISVNGFLHLHEYFYTEDKTLLELFQSFVITTAVPLVIEWFFTMLSIAMETRYQNRPIMAVWRRQWKRHFIVAIVNALAIAIWTSTSLFIAVQGRFPEGKSYCELPFTRL